MSQVEPGEERSTIHLKEEFAFFCQLEMVFLLPSIRKPQEARISIMHACLDPIGNQLLFQMQPNKDGARPLITQCVLQEMKNLLSALHHTGSQCPRSYIEKARVFEEHFKMGTSNQSKFTPTAKTSRQSAMTGLQKNGTPPASLFDYFHPPPLASRALSMKSSIPRAL